MTIDGADDRHQDDERPPRAQRRKQIGVVIGRDGAEKQQIVDEPDQRAEDDRAEAGDDADAEGQHRQHGEVERPDFPLRPIGGEPVRSMAYRRREVTAAARG